MKRQPPLCKLTFRAPEHVKRWIDERAREVMKQSSQKSLMRARGVVVMELATAYIARTREQARESKPA